MANKKGYYRVQFTATPAEQSVFERGKSEDGAQSDKEVVERGLALAALYDRYRKKGDELGSIQNGRLVIVVLL